MLFLLGGEGFEGGAEDGGDAGDGDAVSGLFPGRAVIADDFVTVREALEAQHFPLGQAAFAVH